MEIRQLVKENEALSKTVERLQQDAASASQVGSRTLRTWHPVRDQAIDVNAATLSDGSVGTPVQLLHAWQLRLASLVSTHDRLCNDSNATSPAVSTELHAQSFDSEVQSAPLEGSAASEENNSPYQEVLEEMVQSTPRSCRSCNDLGWSASGAEVLHEVDCQSRECLRLLAFLALADPVLLASTLQDMSPERNLGPAQSADMYRKLAARINLSSSQLVKLKQLLVGSNQDSRINATASSSLTLHPAPAALSSLPSDSFHSMLMSLARHQAGLETVQQQCQKLVRTAVGVPISALLKIFTPRQRAIYLSGIPLALPDWSVLLSFLLDGSKAPQGIDALNAAGLGSMRHHQSAPLPDMSQNQAGFTFGSPVQKPVLMTGSDGNSPLSAGPRSSARESYSGGADGRVRSPEGVTLHKRSTSGAMHPNLVGPELLERQGTSEPKETPMTGITDAKGSFSTPNKHHTMPFASSGVESNTMWMGSPVFSNSAPVFSSESVSVFPDSGHYSGNHLNMPHKLHGSASPFPGVAPISAQPLPFASNAESQRLGDQLDAGSNPFEPNNTLSQLSSHLEPMPDMLRPVGNVPISKSTQQLDEMHDNLKSLLTSGEDAPANGGESGWPVPFPGMPTPVNFATGLQSGHSNQLPEVDHSRGSYESVEGESNSKRLRSCFSSDEAEHVSSEKEVGTAPPRALRTAKRSNSSSKRLAAAAGATAERSPSLFSPTRYNSNAGSSMPLPGLDAPDDGMIPSSSFHHLEPLANGDYGDLLDVFRASDPADEKPAAHPDTASVRGRPGLPPTRSEQLSDVRTSDMLSSLQRALSGTPTHAHRLASARGAMDQVPPAQRLLRSETSRTRHMFSHLSVGRDAARRVAGSPQSAPLPFWGSDADASVPFTFDAPSAPLVGKAPPSAPAAWPQHNVPETSSPLLSSRRMPAAMERSADMFGSTEPAVPLDGPFDQSLQHYLQTGDMLGSISPVMDAHLDPNASTAGGGGSQMMDSNDPFAPLDLEDRNALKHLVGIDPFNRAAGAMDAPAQHAPADQGFHQTLQMLGGQAPVMGAGPANGRGSEPMPIDALLNVPVSNAPLDGPGGECVFMSEG